MSAITDAHRRIRWARALPWLSYRFLELDRCWLTLLGYRFAHESRWQSGGIDAACDAAEDVLELTPGTAGKWQIEDLFRIYRNSKLTGTWTDGGRVFEPPEEWRNAS